MNRIIKYLLFILSVALFITPAEAEWYTDCPACAQHLGGNGKAGPFSSEDECNNFKSSYPNNTFPYGPCYSTGNTSSDSSTSSDGSLVNDSSQLIVGGLMHNDGQALGMGLMGLSASILLNGSQTNPQQEAQQRAQEAAQRAAARRQAEERARQRELIKEQLLGEAPSSGGLHLMGVTQEANLQLMTGAQALAPMTGSVNQTAPKTPASGKKKIKHSYAFNKGYHDASQCYSEHPVTACSSISDSTAYLTCRKDYYAGYGVGAKQEKMKIAEATKLGMLDAEDGKPNNGFNVTNDTGDCRRKLDMAYTNGYSQVSRAKFGKENR